MTWERKSIGALGEEASSNQDEDMIMTSLSLSLSFLCLFLLDSYPLSLSFHQRPEEIIGLKDTEAARCRYHAHTLAEHWNALQLGCHINSTSSFSSRLSASLIPQIQSPFRLDPVYTPNWLSYSDYIMKSIDKSSSIRQIPSMAKMSRSSWSSRTKRRSKSSSFSLYHEKEQKMDWKIKKSISKCASWKRST